MSFLNQEKVTSFPGGRRAFEIYKARKDRSGSNDRGNESNIIPSKLSSQLAAIVDAQTCSGGKVPATLTDIFDLKLGQSELAANRLVELESEKNRAVDHVSKQESEQVKWNAKVLP